VTRRRREEREASGGWWRGRVAASGLGLFQFRLLGGGGRRRRRRFVPPLASAALRLGSVWTIRRATYASTRQVSV
jgi:hypothetical protein